MKREYDVVVIGGGVIGCAVARELSRSALRIALLEATADICNGQSKANTAIVHGGHDAKEGTLKAKFNVRGNAMFDRIAQELDVPFARNGSLVAAFSQEEEPAVDLLYARGRANGVPGLSVIGRDEILRREPQINPAVRKALLVESGGIVCPYELTQAYAENAAHNGVEFFRGARVHAVRREGEDWLVESEMGDFSARAVVNCAGIHSDEINNMVSRKKYSMTPRRGEYYIVDKQYAGRFHAAVFQVPTAMGKGVLVAPTVDGTILLGPTADDIPDKDDTRSTARGLARVLEGARKTWPDLPGRAFITTFSGVRAPADAGAGVLGEAPDAPGFFNALGVESPGLSSAPAIGEFLAGAVAEKLHAAPNPDFDPIRRGIPKFRLLSNEARAALIAQDPAFGQIVCRCETVTEAEIRESIRRPVGARTLDGVKRRTRAGMGRCQSGFCSTRVMEILCEELGLSPLEVTKCGGGSRFVEDFLFGGERDA